jgi:hypothetical protein
VTGVIGPDDPRYQAVLDKQFNKRFRARPEFVRLAASAADVVAAVQDAVDSGRRLVVTSGGHCLEGFVSDPDARVILDVSAMKDVAHDAERRAIAVGAGATVGETFRALSERWGVVVPLGEYPGIGMGGHVAGGAFGFLCRQLGLAADYLYAVEVVTVDADARARVVVATRDADDPNRELWWAHTGGGAGNFGVVTRYWFRAMEAAGDDPSDLLPRPPESITTFRTEWTWDAMDRGAFLRLLQNHGNWSERNSAPDAAATSLWTLLIALRPPFGRITLRGLSTEGDAAGAQVQEYLAAITAGLPQPSAPEIRRLSWLEFALDPFPDLFAGPPGGVSVKVKDALLKRRLDDRQIGVAYEQLTRTDVEVAGGMMGFATYGGRVNAVEPGATASASRGAIFAFACTAGWLDAKDEAASMAWVRELYRELFAGTGGVPVPGDAYDGALINHPDTDLADPALNTSGVPWPTLYYQAGYPRLQRVKAQWDPRDVFRHALAVRPE